MADENLYRSLRLKADAADKLAKDYEELSVIYEALRSEFMVKAERLEQAQQLLAAHGLSLPEAKKQAVREEENDARTPQAERGFTR